MGLSLLLLLLLVVCGAAAAARPAANRTKTKTVVLMLENRSFSHMLGFLRKELTGKEFNRFGGARKTSLSRLPLFFQAQLVGSVLAGHFLGKEPSVRAAVRRGPLHEGDNGQNLRAGI